MHLEPRTLSWLHAYRASCMWCRRDGKCHHGFGGEWTTSYSRYQQREKVGNPLDKLSPMGRVITIPSLKSEVIIDCVFLHMSFSVVASFLLSYPILSLHIMQPRNSRQSISQILYASDSAPQKRFKTLWSVAKKILSATASRYLVLWCDALLKQVNSADQVGMHLVWIHFQFKCSLIFC